jgi:hypothetical protein
MKTPLKSLPQALRRLFSVVWITFWFALCAWFVLWLDRQHFAPFHLRPLIKLPLVFATIAQWAFLSFVALLWTGTVAHRVGLEKYADRAVDAVFKCLALLAYPLRRLWLRLRAAVAIAKLDREAGGKVSARVTAVKPVLPNKAEGETIQMPPPSPGVTFEESHDEIDHARALEILAAWKDLRTLVRCFSVFPAAEYVTQVKFDGFVVALSKDDVTFQIKDTEDFFLMSLQDCVTSQHEHITEQPAYRLTLILQRQGVSFYLSELFFPEQATKS